MHGYVYGRHNMRALHGPRSTTDRRHHDIVPTTDTASPFRDAATNKERRRGNMPKSPLRTTPHEAPIGALSGRSLCSARPAACCRQASLIAKDQRSDTHTMGPKGSIPTSSCWCSRQGQASLLSFAVGTCFSTADAGTMQLLLVCCLCCCCCRLLLLLW